MGHGRSDFSTVLDRSSPEGVAVSGVASEFGDEFELEPEASSARGGFPPWKNTAAGVLDPPFPPKRPPGADSCGESTSRLSHPGSVTLGWACDRDILHAL
jgi:hypothetical protein